MSINNILSDETIVNNFLGNMEKLKGRNLVLPHGIIYNFSDNQNIFIHYSTLCFRNLENKIGVLNPPKVGENFIKRCFFEAYCDTIETLYGVGAGENIECEESIARNLLTLTAIERKRKENSLWQTFTRNMD